jgi:hypothetical protein
MDLSSFQKLKLDKAAGPLVLSNDKLMRIRVYILIDMMRSKK